MHDTNTEGKLPVDDACVTCGAVAGEYCHIEGNHDDAYEKGVNNGHDQGTKIERERIEDLVPTIAAALTEHLRQNPARSKHATTKAFEAIIFTAVQR